MTEIQSEDVFDVAVVGSGPSGVSVALHLQRYAPEILARTVVLEKAHHPRHKLCGGGLTGLSQRLLASLDLDLVLQYVPIDEIQLRFRGQRVVQREKDMIKIVRRDRFDAALASAARERGVELREGLEVTGMTRDEDGVTLITGTGSVRARVVVAADGAKSTVRRHIGLEGPSRIARSIEVLTPEDPGKAEEFRRHLAVFDFSYVPDGLQGYAWDFPSSLEGEPFMNRGAYDSRVLPQRERADMKGVFGSYLRGKGLRLDDYDLMGNPGRWFDSHAEFSAPRVLFVGDAAGIEPLGGDGISCSLWYGDVAAQEIAAAFGGSEFSFGGYKGRLLAHPLGKHMSMRTQQAKVIYGRRSRLYLRLLWAGMAARARIRRRRTSFVHGPQRT